MCYNLFKIKKWKLSLNNDRKMNKIFIDLFKNNYVKF